MSSDKVTRTQFRATHKRIKDDLPAMLLAIRDGIALYRVRWTEAGKINDNTISTSEEYFVETFA